jgi:hypothetical protein
MLSPRAPVPSTFKNMLRDGGQECLKFAGLVTSCCCNAVPQIFCALDWGVMKRSTWTPRNLFLCKASLSPSFPAMSCHPPANLLESIYDRFMTPLFGMAEAELVQPPLDTAAGPSQVRIWLDHTWTSRSYSICTSSTLTGGWLKITLPTSCSLL